MWTPRRRDSLLLHSAYLRVQTLQSLHWVVKEAAERRKPLFCGYLDFANAFYSVDHEALLLWLKKIKIPDMDLLQCTDSGAFYV